MRRYGGKAYRTAVKIRKAGGAKRHIGASALLILALFFAAAYLNDTFWNVDWLPKWHVIYELFGLRKASVTVSEGEASVRFIDVGQGDCSLITAGGKHVLIDGGEASASADVISCLKGLEVGKLDIVVATHPHSDHIGALSRVIGEFGAERLIMPEVREDMLPVTTSYMNLLEAAEKCGAEAQYAGAGDVIRLTDDCSLEFVAPLRFYDDLNNQSIVLRLVYGETSFLFTGDIEQEAEREIYDSGAELSADVIKIAHHGSRSSSLKVFVQAVSPGYAVISAGLYNDYGHPHVETLRLLENLGAKVYRTDLDGTVTFISDGKTLRVETEKGRAA